MSEVSRARTSRKHRVRLGDCFPSASEHSEQLLDGFKHGYQLLLDRRNELASNRAFLEVLDNLDLRVLVRDTTTYSQLQVHLLNPQFLKDGIDRSIELEWLAHPLCASNSPTRVRTLIYEFERDAMEQLDVPRFATSAWALAADVSDDKDLWTFWGRRNSGVLLRRLKSLNATDLRRQCETAAAAVASGYRRKL